MAKGSGKGPSWKNEPKPKDLPSLPKIGEKTTRFGGIPESTERQTPAWQFHRCDMDHAQWGWGKLSSDDFLGIIRTSLVSFETMTWAEIHSAAGGRSRGNNHHLVPVSGCSKEAQNRLAELKVDDLDEIFSLRLTGTLRLFGVKEGRVLRFLWHDPEHSVFPVGK